MAIDNREKRAGATGLHFMPQLPIGDGTIDQADRQQVVGVYPGILATAAGGARPLVAGSLAGGRMGLV